MKQDIKGNEGQITQTGDIVINCHGGKDCPWRSEEASESKRQAEFARATGIWCSAGARQQLEVLMTSHEFTAPMLRAAWRSDSLCWDMDQRRMVVRTHWIEPFFGNGVIILMGAYLALLGLQLAASNSWQNVAQMVAGMVLYGGMMSIAWRFILRPYRVANRIRRVLANPSDDAGPAAPLPVEQAS